MGYKIENPWRLKIKLVKLGDSCLMERKMNSYRV